MLKFAIEFAAMFAFVIFVGVMSFVLMMWLLHLMWPFLPPYFQF